MKGSDTMAKINETPKIYKALKISSIVMAVIVLLAQLTEALLLWTANRFFPLAQGAMDQAALQIWATRSKLLDARGVAGSVYFRLFPLFCLALLILLLFLRRPLAAKTKLICAVGFAAASMVVLLPWVLTDPLYPPTNYLLQPAFCLSRLAVFLVVSLIIDFFRELRLKRMQPKDSI